MQQEKENGRGNHEAYNFFNYFPLHTTERRAKDSPFIFNVPFHFNDAINSAKFFDCFAHTTRQACNGKLCCSQRCVPWVGVKLLCWSAHAVSARSRHRLRIGASFTSHENISLILCHFFSLSISLTEFMLRRVSPRLSHTS